MFIDTSIIKQLRPYKLMDVLETDSFEYWGTGSRLHGITVGVF